MLDLATLTEKIPQALRDLDVEWPHTHTSGKVRESYSLPGRQRLLVTTDRLSAFDVVLAALPYKGQVLNQLSSFWFEKTADIVANHLLDVPDPNVSLVHECVPLPVEIIVRGYITGSTKTALWTLYDGGARKIYGHRFPEGLKKNDRLPEPILTLAIFKRGQSVAEAAGFCLVDTKYEFGHDPTGSLVLIDEVHTPDSSRFWKTDTMDHPQPDQWDKEYVRLWYAQQNYRGDGTPPTLPEHVISEAARRYIALYEGLTGRTFEPAPYPAASRIADVLASYLK